MKTWNQTIPEFDSEPLVGPSGFVSALSSPSIPTCNLKGTGTEVGNLISIRISADIDDGSWVYTNDFSINFCQFGTSTPVP